VIQRLTFDITQPYITEPLEQETFVKACVDSHPSVLHRLYYISNNKKDISVALELLDHPTLIGKVSVHMQCAYAGRAKAQASAIKGMKKYLKHTPKYVVSCRIHTINGAKEVFTFKHATTNQDKVYSLIAELENIITKRYCNG